MSRRRNSLTIALLVIVIVFSIDQLSKQWVLTTFQQAGTTLALPGPVDLTLVFNRSNAFGLIPVSGEITRWGLAALNVAVAAVLAWILIRRPMSRASTLGVGFLIAGAAGNALDRIRFGAVIDFFNASKLGFIWVFNVADASIDVGIGLLLLSALLTPGSSRPSTR